MYRARVNPNYGDLVFAPYSICTARYCIGHTGFCRWHREPFEPNQRRLGGEHAYPSLECRNFSNVVHVEHHTGSGKPNRQDWTENDVLHNDVGRSTVNEWWTVCLARDGL